MYDYEGNGCELVKIDLMAEGQLLKLDLLSIINCQLVTFLGAGSHMASRYYSMCIRFSSFTVQEIKQTYIVNLYCQTYMYELPKI